MNLTQQEQGEISTSNSSSRSGDFQLLTANKIVELNINPRSNPVYCSNSQSSLKSIYSNQPSTIISHTLSALQKHCESNNISYTSVINAHELRYKINSNIPGTPSDLIKNQEAHEQNQHISKLKSSVYCNQNTEILKFKFSNKSPSASVSGSTYSLSTHSHRDKQNCNATIKCNLYFPVHFNALRKGLYGKECDFEMQFIESLSECTPCHLTGGKKGTFCKTADDKYLLKFIKQNELNMFLHNFPSYFKHMTNIFQNNLPSLLVPIIGCYAISQSDSKMMQYILVMPNLFSESNQQSLKKFDLKGTLNSRRYIEGGEDNVRLDKNFIEYTHGSPLTLNGQSSKYLSDAIENDTKFLCESNIMDYSLLIGINEENNEIIGGIIDYIETFSVAKRAERIIKSFIKDSTIQEPSVYKKRFQNSLTNKYFIAVKA